MSSIAPAPAAEISEARVRLTDLPFIGKPMQGGIFAGFTLEGHERKALLLLPGDHNDTTWQKAMDWAKEQGGELPSRFDALALYQNVPGEFKKDVYWTGVQHASGADYAWDQFFTSGYQVCWH